MSLISTIFNEILYRPLFNALILLYNFLPGHDFGVAIIILTFLLRLIMFPLTKKGIIAQKKIADLQPKIKELHEKHKHDKEAQARATMEFYKTEKINPFGGCLPLLAQLPVLFTLYRVLLGAFKSLQPEVFYSFVTIPSKLNLTFLGLINLQERNIILAVLAGGVQFAYSKISMKTQPNLGGAKEGGPNFQKIMGSQMTYFMPILTIFIALSLPAGLALYWTATTVFSIVEYKIIKK